MKNIFEKPEIQIIKISENDIITTSPATTIGTDVWTPWLDL